MRNNNALAAFLWHQIYTSNFYRQTTTTQLKFTDGVCKLLDHYEHLKGDKNVND